MDWCGFDSIMYAIKKNYYDIMCLLIDLSSVPIDFNKNFFVIFLFLLKDLKNNLFDNGCKVGII